MKKIILTFFLLIFFGYTKTLCNLLPNKIDGYKSLAKCEFINIQNNFGTSQQAYQEYSKNGNKIILTLIKGRMAQQAIAPFMAPMQIETNEMLMKVTDCDGFKCAISYNKKENGGVIIILLNQNIPAALTMNFENISIEMAKKLLSNINLKNIKNNL